MKSDGGPAFPCDKQMALFSPDGLKVEEIVSVGAFQGMSLRDYFAAHAINGLTLLYQASLTDWAPEKVARNAYAIADAMLKARAETQP